MALCTRCGRQTEGAAEFCSNCGSHQGSGGRDRSQQAAAGGTGYLRPFASRAPGGTALRPGNERPEWAAPDSGPQQRAGQPPFPSDPPPGLPGPAADYAGNARFGTGGLTSGDPLTDDADLSGGGFSLVPRGPFEPARPAYPQEEDPETTRPPESAAPQEPDGYGAPAAAGYQVGDSPPAGYRVTDSPAAGYPRPDSPAAGYPRPDSPAAGYPGPDTPPAAYPGPDSPAAGHSGPDTPPAGHPVTGEEEPGWPPPRFGPDEDLLTDRAPPEYPAGTGQFAPGPAIPAQRPADTPYNLLAPYDLLAGRPVGYGQPPAPGAPAGTAPAPGPQLPGQAPPGPFADMGRVAAQFSADSYPAASYAPAESAWPAQPAASHDTGSRRAAADGPGSYADQDEDAPPNAPRTGRWVSIAAATVVLIICAASAVILLSHGKSPASPGGAARGSNGQRLAAGAPSPAVRALITVEPGAASGPDGPAVVTFLTRYFTAINHHDFAAYRRLFSTSFRNGLSQSAFATGYGSTRDSQATLHGITSAATGQLTAAVTFTSHQQPAASPNNSACTAWTISLYLSRHGASFLLVSPPAGYQASFRNCS